MVISGGLANGGFCVVERSKKARPELFERHWMAYREGRLQYGSVGDPTHPLVIYIHGSPGSWDNAIDIAREPEIMAHTYLVSADRPGFGSGTWTGAEESLICQAESLYPLLDLDQTGQGAVLVGHSYGGPVAVQLALLRPDKVKAVILIGGSVDPDQEKHAWYNKFAKSGLGRKMIGKTWTHSNDEIWQLKPELARMAADWSQLNMPFTLIHGSKDKLVPFPNVYFVQQHLTQASLRIVRLEGMGHFLPWQTPTLIAREILRYTTP